jgi:hypothetical protein
MTWQAVAVCGRLSYLPSVGLQFPEVVEKFQPLRTSPSSVASLYVFTDRYLQVTFWLWYSIRGFIAVRAHVDVPQ